MVLARLFEGQVTGFYVDVGAHHPQRFSNTHYFYKQGWHGINIEPNPEGYKLFQRARKRDINVECGISEQPGELTYVMFNESALNTFDINLANQRKNTTSYKITNECKVNVQRLDEVFKRYLTPNQKIDFLTVDAEGHDLAVLKSNNWEIFRPKIILVEELELSNIAESIGQVGDFLSNQDYNFFAKTYNTLFFKDSRSD